jgi:hypothetical protein
MHSWQGWVSVGLFANGKREEVDGGLLEKIRVYGLGMALKFKLKSKEEIPAGLEAPYAEREGIWILDADGAADKAKLASSAARTSRYSRSGMI